MASEKKKTSKYAGTARTVISAILAIYVIMTAFNNRSILIEQIRKLITGESRFGDMVDRISGGLRSDFQNKYDYINLNGLFTRAAGKITSNRVSLLNNGSETMTIAFRRMDDRADNLNKLSNFLDEQGIPFVYVQAPDKVDTGKKLLPRGIADYGNDEADELLRLLEKAGVMTLDLRPYISASPEQSSLYFYSTDHHWNSRGAFIGFQQVVGKMKEMFPDLIIDEELLDEDNWELHTKGKWFLGSSGKRVGIFFGQVDDLMWHTPRKETCQSCAIPYSSLFYTGNFEEACIRNGFVDRNDPNYFTTRPHFIYIGSDYALVQHRNINALSDKKILILKDSFTLQMQAYLSTLFKELDVIDLRYFKAGSLLDYVAYEKPDVVIQMLYPGSLSVNSLFTYGFEKKNAENAETLESVLPIQPEVYDDVEFPETIRITDDKSHNRLRELKPGRTYCLTFDRAELIQGNSDYLIAAVHDEKTNQDLQVRLIDIDYYNQKGGYSWTFCTPEKTEGQLSLMLMTGQSSTRPRTYREDAGNFQKDRKPISEVYSISVTDVTDNESGLT